MEINLLVVNVGNSRVALGTFVAGELEHTDRVNVCEREQLVQRIAEAWRRIADRPNAEVAGASVNPPLMAEVEAAVRQASGRNVQWVGRDIDLPIPVLTENPAETGVDRILNIAAAHEQMGRGCVVVDAGTAVTVDCCNDAGEFLGGAIAPGVSLMLEALHRGTACLPLVQMEVPADAFGRNTRQAIVQGAYHGIRGMVRELVEQYATRLGYWPEVIATGGDAKLLFEGWELIHAIAPDLTLYGIALAYAEHHIKHGT